VLVLEAYKGYNRYTSTTLTPHTYTFCIEAVLSKTTSKIDQNLKSAQTVILKLDSFIGTEVVVRTIYRTRASTVRLVLSSFQSQPIQLIFLTASFIRSSTLRVRVQSTKYS